MEVYKFGGLSTANVENIACVREIIRNNLNKKPLLVFSAMGRTTRLLEQIVGSGFKHESGLKAYIEEFRKFHSTMAANLCLTPSSGIRMLMEELEASVSEPDSDYDRYYDRIICYGELIASRIMSEYLSASGITNRWKDVRDLLVARPPYREGKVDFEQSMQNIQCMAGSDLPQELLVTQGFIARTPDGNSISLGLDGSDYSAAILAYCLNASALTIWKDVPGVLNADPRYFSHTTLINRLSYRDAVEQAFYGASVIHPKTIKPLQNKAIPLFVKSFVNPQQPGTRIQGDELPASEKVSTYILKKDQCLLTLASQNFSFIMEDRMRDIFEILTSLHIKANLMQNTAISFTICVDRPDSGFGPLIRKLSGKFELNIMGELELITVRNYTDSAVARAIEGRKVHLQMITLDVAQFVVEKSDKEINI